MMRELTAAILAAGLSFAGMETIATYDDGLSDREFRYALGISDVVYDCAVGALDGANEEQVIGLISAVYANPDAVNVTPTVERVQACVMLDPFGWQGTENEWAIDLIPGKDN